MLSMLREAHSCNVAVCFGPVFHGCRVSFEPPVNDYNRIDHCRLEGHMLAARLSKMPHGALLD